MVRRGALAARSRAYLCLVGCSEHNWLFTPLQTSGCTTTMQLIYIAQHRLSTGRYCCMGTGTAAAPPPSAMKVCRRCACRCVAAAACAFLCLRTAAQCSLWCRISASIAGGSAPPPSAAAAAAASPAAVPAAAALPSPDCPAALPGSGASSGAGCCSVAAASSDRGASGGSLEVGSGCMVRGARWCTWSVMHPRYKQASTQEDGTAA